MAAVLVTAFAAAVAVRYRHYGVYETNEDDQLVDDEDLLRNPVVVLDRNQESYINLKYPVLVSNANNSCKNLVISFCKLPRSSA